MATMPLFRVCILSLFVVRGGAFEHVTSDECNITVPATLIVVIAAMCIIIGSNIHNPRDSPLQDC